MVLGGSVGVLNIAQVRHIRNVMHLHMHTYLNSIARPTLLAPHLTSGMLTWTTPTSLSSHSFYLTCTIGNRSPAQYPTTLPSGYTTMLTSLPGT